MARGLQRVALIVLLVPPASACQPRQGPPLEVLPPVGATPETPNVRIDLAFLQDDQVLTSRAFATPLGTEASSEISGPDGTHTVSVTARATQTPGVYEVEVSYSVDGELVTQRTAEVLDGLVMTVSGAPTLRILVQQL